MKKIRLYLDWYPMMEERFANAMASPGEKSKGTKRYAIDVVLPEDPNEPDAVLTPDSVKRMPDDDG